MSNPDGNYYFAGLGFTELDLSIGTINAGQLRNPSFEQILADISFDSASGKISFAVPNSQELIRDITFTGNVINDDTGLPVGFSGTWTGERVPIIRAEQEVERAASKEPAFGEPAPGGLTVQGFWSAVLDQNSPT